MKNQYYLRLEGGGFGFTLKGLHKIKDSDIEISNEDYNRYFEMQSQGKQFRIKEKATGNTLFDYVEEYKAEVIIDTTPTDKDRIKVLEMALLEVL